MKVRLAANLAAVNGSPRRMPTVTKGESRGTVQHMFCVLQQPAHGRMRRELKLARSSGRRGRCATLT